MRLANKLFKVDQFVKADILPPANYLSRNSLFNLINYLAISGRLANKLIHNYCAEPGLIFAGAK